MEDDPAILVPCIGALEHESFSYKLVPLYQPEVLFSTVTLTYFSAYRSVYIFKTAKLRRDCRVTRFGESRLRIRREMKGTGSKFRTDFLSI